MSTILIVEDNRASMKLMGQVLVSRGHDVIEATEAEQGLRLARSRRPDVIVMDVQLPGRDGLTAVRELRNDVDLMSIPIVIVTARGMVDERDKILTAGCDAYLLKPIQYRQFISTIERLASEGDTKAYE